MPFTAPLVALKESWKVITFQETMQETIKTPYNTFPNARLVFLKFKTSSYFKISLIF